MRVSTTQFALNPVDSDQSFWQRVEGLVKQAANENSEVLLLPEYFSLSWLVFRVGEATFRRNLERANELLPEIQDRFQKLSEQYNIAIIAGTIPVIDQERILNRCLIFRPRQEVLAQDKINMTRFENEEWKVSGGTPILNTFRIGEALCAVATCYDVEFPSVTALAAAQGVEILFVPSCTDDVHGYWRVRLCSQARTIENQCYVVMSSIVGGHPDWPEIESHFGQGGIYTPSDLGMPEGGVRRLGLLNAEGVITEAISRDELLRIRQNGTVLNLRDTRSPVTF